MTKSVKHRKNNLSKSRIIATTIEILDADGENGLTFRVLAERLSTGTGALYYYVANKEELFSAALDTIIAQYLSAAPAEPNPSLAIRTIALTLWDAVESHPWVGSRLLVGPNSLRIASIYEAIGSRLGPQGVPKEDQFNVSSAICSYIVGNLSQQASNAQRSQELAHQGYDRESYLRQFTQSWRDLSQAEYPFMHEVIDQFPNHDDRAQYLAGIDLLLSGISRNYS